MSFEAGWSHTTYSPVLLFLAALLESLLVVFLITSVRRKTAGRAGKLLSVIVLSPLPLLFLARGHLPLLSSWGASFCFGELGLVHVISFLLPPAVGLFTLFNLRSKALQEQG